MLSVVLMSAVAFAHSDAQKPRRVSVLVSVHFGIPCVLMRLAAINLYAKSPRLHDNASRCSFAIAGVLTDRLVG